MVSPLAGLAVGMGAGAGAGISTVVMAPFTAANNFLGSFYFGYGMILGERLMYQADWSKIQGRLEKGEKLESILHEYTRNATAAVMKEAKIIMTDVQKMMIQMLGEFAGITPPVEVTTGITGETPIIADTEAPPEQTSIVQDPTGNVTVTSTTHYIVTVPKSKYTAQYTIKYLKPAEKGKAMNRIVSIWKRLRQASIDGNLGPYKLDQPYYWVTIENLMWLKNYPVLYEEASSAFFI